MRVLFDIVHPADVLFFRHPIRMLAQEGASIRIASRRKDVACDLLDEFGLDHKPLSAAGSGLAGLAGELVARDLSMLRLAATWRPDVMVGLGGVSIAHAGWLTRRPAIAFYMADTAKLQTRLTWPFISHLYVPESYAGALAEGRTTRFPGIKELSYFHPENFAVEETRARAAGWTPDRQHFLVRVVRWGANHDVGKSGWSDGELDTLIERLSAHGQVHLSSERELPPHLGEFQYRGKKADLHHLLAKCRLYVGESATMAHEAAILGCPAIYSGHDHPGTTRSLAAASVIDALHQSGLDDLLDAVDRNLAETRLAEFTAARATYLAGKGNLATFIVNAIQRHAR